jgi:hypothetical protein
MDESGQPAFQARDEAFRRLGRNLYLFQLIERQLKHLVVHTAIAGHPEELSTKLAMRSNTARKTSMGTLAEQFTTEVFGDKGSDGAELTDPHKPWFSFSFRIAADDQFVRQRKKEMRRLVKERNKLVHTVAADIRPGDTDRWIELGVFLDEQRTELVAEHEKLRLLIKDLGEMAQHAAQAIESELLNVGRYVSAKYICPIPG